MLDTEIFDTKYLPPGQEQVYRGPDTAIPHFYLRQVRDEAATLASGSVVYKEEEFVRIRIPGDRFNVIDTNVSDHHRQRWPRQYEAFKAKKEQKVEGFPLEAWPVASPAVVSSLAEIHIQTVEQLANMAETGLPKMQGIREIQMRAREFITAKADSASVIKLQRTMEDQRKQLELRDEAIQQLQRRLEVLETTGQEQRVRRRKADVGTDGSETNSP